jgi:hypothetical protein
MPRQLRPSDRRLRPMNKRMRVGRGLYLSGSGARIVVRGHGAKASLVSSSLRSRLRHPARPVLGLHAGSGRAWLWALLLRGPVAGRRRKSKR